MCIQFHSSPPTGILQTNNVIGLIAQLVGTIINTRKAVRSKVAASPPPAFNVQIAAAFFLNFTSENCGL